MIDINFDEKGNPTPYGIIETNISSLKGKYVDEFPSSITRRLIFNEYSGYIVYFFNALNNSWIQWINGSFTTNKENPNDIDLVNLVKVDNKFILNPNKKLFNNPNSEEEYLVHSSFIPIYDSNDLRYSEVTEYLLNYWKKWFGQDKENKPKGIIQIEITQDTIKKISNEKT
jgi:hypothetical protein